MTMQSLQRNPALKEIFPGKIVKEVGVVGASIRILFTDGTFLGLRDSGGELRVNVEDGIDAGNPPVLLYEGQWRGLPEYMKSEYEIDSAGFYRRKGEK